MKLFAGLLLSAAAAAHAQNIAVPASSLYSGARSVVSITPVDLSGYATRSELDSVSGVASSAYNTARSAFSYGYDAYVNQGYNRPWSQWFKGQLRGGIGAATGFAYSVLVDDSGAVFVNGWATNDAWTYMGRPTAGEAVRWWSGCLTGECAREVVEVFPINANGNGIPGDFTVRVANAMMYYPGPPAAGW